MKREPKLRTPIRRGRILVLLIIILLLLTPSMFYALDAPHTSFTSGYTINCGNCHWVHNSDSAPWMSIPSSPDPADDTINNRRCYACHDGSKSLIPAAKTHSSSTTGSTRWSSMGGWSIECVTCHNPHQQRQTRSWGAPTYIQTGSQPTVGGWDTADNWTHITIPDTLTDNYYGYYFMPDKNYPFFYKIESDTSGNTFNVKGDVLETYVKTGGYAIVFGKNVSESINFTNPGGTVKGGPVRLFRPSGDNGPGDTWNNNTATSVCYVCHTQTRHWSEVGDTTTHNDRADCTLCHQHINGFVHGGPGTGCQVCHGHDAGYTFTYDDGVTYTSQGRGTFQAHSTHTENDSDDLKGPNLHCSDCHNTSSFPNFKDGAATLAATTVCNPCHSPGGDYDGVNNSVIGAKANWHSGIYVSTNNSTLKAGKEKWCAGCHDSAPSYISGVYAPDVIGDESASYTYGTGYGFYKTGHGLPSSQTYPASGGATYGAGKGCSDCHDLAASHIDGNERTFDCDSSTAGACSSSYRDGYRLKNVNGNLPMQMPPTGRNMESYQLCFTCHINTNDWLSSDLEYRGETNFYDNGRGSEKNLHIYHLRWSQNSELDWDAGFEANMSCITCHNVHGSKNPVMIRSGELTGLPSLSVRYGNNCSTHTPGDEEPVPNNITLAVSTKSTMLGRLASPYCAHCHGTGTGVTSVLRTPVGIPNFAPELNWVSGPGYESDGVNPDSAPSGTEFTFKVKYSDVNQDGPPSTIQVWIDKNNDGSYQDNVDPALDEKIDMTSAFVELDTCATYFTGVNYVATVNIDKALATGSSIRYRFFAEYGGVEATGPPTQEKTLTVLNDRPVLSWTGEDNFAEEGVNPDYGPAGGIYTFRIKYIDDDGDACPAGGSSNIQVWIDLNGNGVYDDSEKFNLAEVDTNDHDCTTAGGGKLYYTNVNLPNTSGANKIYNYRFYGFDGTDAATGAPTSSSTVIVAATTNKPPHLEWNSGTCRPQGAMPPKSATSSTINFSVKYFDDDNQCPASGTSAIQLWVDLNNDGDYDDAGEKINLVEESASDTDCTTAGGGKVYSTTVGPTTVGTGIKYEFHATDGIDIALGDPAVTGGTVDVILADYVVKQDGTEDFTTISAAITAVGSNNNKTILVYNGTYNEYLTITQDPLTLVSACGAAATIISNTNNPVVYFNKSQNSIFDGFTVTGSTGKGIYSYGQNFDGNDSTPTIKNSIIRNNGGSGIATNYSNTTINNCEIYGNLYGGVNITGSATISDTNIHDNSTNFNGGGISGGHLSLTNVVIKNNTAGNSGGGIFVNAGSTHPASTYEKITLLGNTAEGMGGGAYFTYTSPVTFTNSLVADNSAPTGGGLGVGTWASVQFKNSTIANNTATGFGGAFYSTDGAVSLANSIAWGNRAASGHIEYLTGSGNKTIYLYDSIIENNGDDNITDDNYFIVNSSSTVSDAGGNYDYDPNFIDSTNADKTKRDYHIQEPSIAIDNAADDSGWGIPSDDLDGNSRPFGGAADIGAYEYHTPVYSTTAGTATGTAAGATSIAVSMPYADDYNSNNTYTVDYKLNADSTWTNWVSAAAHAASPYTTIITGLTTGATYDVRLTYNDADGVNGTNLQIVSNLTLPFDSTTVGTAAASAAGDHSISVSMPYADDANSNNTYTVDYKLSTEPTVWTNWATGAAHVESQYSTTITGLTAGATYDVRMTYNDADGISGTNPQTVTGITLTNNSTTVGTTTASAAGDQAISISMPYTGDNNGTNTYTVRYKLSSSGTWLDWGTNPKAHTASPYIDAITGLTPGATYDVQLTYNDADGVNGANPQTVKNITLTHNSATVGTATAAASSTTSVSVSMPYTGDNNANNTYTVDYKLSTEPTVWTNWVTGAAHTASPYATTITGLTAGASYDVRMTYNDADGVNGTNPQTATVTLSGSAISVCSTNSAPFNKIQTTIDDPGTTNGATLLVCAGTYSENINYHGKLITIKSVSGAASTTIQGIVNGYPGKPVVTFSTGETAGAVLDGFTIDNIDSNQATRGIYITGAAPTIKNCIIQGNSATNCNEDSGACGGGGVYIKNAAPVFDTCTIQSNVATSRNGGGIYITGSTGGATITNSIIGSSGKPNSANYGGGIYITGSTTGTLSISGSTIAYNTTTQRGAGIYATGVTNTTTLTNTSVSNNTSSQIAGGIYSDSPLSFTGCNINNNATGSTASYDGGGIYLTGAAASATISGGTINSNSGRYGGGIYITGSTAATPLSISNVTMSSNTGNYGGAIYLTGVTNAVSVAGTTISGNTGQASGGGIYNNAVTLDIANSHIDSNIVSNGSQRGGGLYLTGAKTTTITNTTVNSNTVDGLGGGIYAGGGATLQFTGSSINSNTSSSSSGGGIALDGASILSISRTNMRGNKAGQYGSGIYFASTSTTASSITNCTISGNTHINTASLDGGGIYTNGGTINIINSTLAGNYAYRYGGGIRVQAGTMNVKNSIIYGNTAGTSGPQISGAPTVTYSDIEGGYSGTGNINSDPSFVSFTAGDKAGNNDPKTSGDFHIQSGSPCKNTGNNADAPTNTDIDGDTRILNSTVDMGSDEYSGTSLTLTLHPSGMAAEGSGNFTPTGGTWADVLDIFDSGAYVSVCCQDFGTFYVDMDDTGLSGTPTINSVTIKVAVKNSAAGDVNIGYKTGTATTWKGDTSVDTGYQTLTLNASTNSDGGAWTLADLNNIKVAVLRDYVGPTYCYVTEVAVEINYTP